MSLSAFVTLFLAVLAVAVPTPLLGDYPQLSKRHKACSTSQAKLVLPAGQTNLTAPTGDVSFVLLGVGYQNYTCGATGTYTSAGATAELFDLSCISAMDSKLFDNIQDISFAAWSRSNFDLKNICQDKVPFKLGAHFFQTNANGGLSPVWDFRGDSAPNQPDAFVVAAKAAGLSAPTGTQDVDWLQLNHVSGALATTIYRTHTKGGQPPASCTPGSAGHQVKYVAKYWLYGSNITLS